MSLFNRFRRLFPHRALQRPVRVVTDSTADIPPLIAQELGIRIVPLQVVFGDQEYRDGIDMTSEEFFRRLEESHDHPRTSQPSVGDFQHVYESLAQQTNRILSIHLSSKFSGTVNAARQAAETFADRCRIEVLDSETVSMSMGFAVIAAARAAQSGADLDACADAARSVLRRQRIAIALDTLEYLRRGGRIGRAQAFLGSLLRLKPVLTIRDGEAHPLARSRTRKKAIEEIMRVCFTDTPVTDAAVMYSTDSEDAHALAREVRQRYPDANVHIGRIGPVIGVHGGPGIVGMVVVTAEEEGERPSEPS
jgi:DegV family protein with EDD domain